MTYIITTNNINYESANSSLNAQINYHYSCDTSSGGFTITLPSLSGITSGQEIRIKLAIAGNDLTVSRSGSDTIEGSLTSYVLSIAKSSITLVANTVDSNWEIV